MSQYLIVVGGIIYTPGLYLGDFIDTFGTSRSATSIIGSLQIGVMFLVGPIVAGLVNRVGCRVIAIAGSIIAAVLGAVAVLSAFPSVGLLVAGTDIGKIRILPLKSKFRKKTSLFVR